MGRIIDRIALTALGAAALYLYFLNSGLGIAASIALALFCAGLGRWLILHRPRRYRWTQAQAEAAIRRVACLPVDEADAALTELARACRLKSEDRIIPLARYPGGSVGVDEVFSLWQAHRGVSSIALAASCPFTPEARACAASLTEPAVALVDKKAIMRVIRKTGLYVQEVPREPLGRRLRGMLHRVRTRRVHPRALLGALSLLAAYRLLRNPAYLAAALFTVVLAGASWLRGRREA